MNSNKLHTIEPQPLQFCKYISEDKIQYILLQGNIFSKTLCRTFTPTSWITVLPVVPVLRNITTLARKVVYTLYICCVNCIIHDARERKPEFFRACRSVIVAEPGPSNSILPTSNHHAREGGEVSRSLQSGAYAGFLPGIVNQQYITPQ